MGLFIVLLTLHKVQNDGKWIKVEVNSGRLWDSSETLRELLLFLGHSSSSPAFSRGGYYWTPTLQSCPVQCVTTMKNSWASHSFYFMYIYNVVFFIMKAELLYLSLHFAFFSFEFVLNHLCIFRCTFVTGHLTLKPCDLQHEFQLKTPQMFHYFRF